MSEETVYPSSWKVIVDKHGEYMANENPDHGWYYRQHLENLAEELWLNIMEEKE